MTDLSKILNDCEGEQFYCSSLNCDVTLDRIIDSNKDKYSLKFSYEEIINGVNQKFYISTSKEGVLFDEVIIFPSKTNKDWSTFKPSLKIRVLNDYLDGNNSLVRIIYKSEQDVLFPFVGVCEIYPTIVCLFDENGNAAKRSNKFNLIKHII